MTRRQAQPSNFGVIDAGNQDTNKFARLNFIRNIQSIQFRYGELKAENHFKK